MPSSKTHTKYAIATVIVVLIIVSTVWKLPFTQIIDIPAILFITIFYAMLPDVDSKTSSSRKGVLALMFFLLLCCYPIYKFVIPNENIFILISVIGLFGLAIAVSKHRGIFHTPLMGAVLSAPLYFLNPYYVGVAFISFCSHLIVDWLNKKLTKTSHRSSIGTPFANRKF